MKVITSVVFALLGLFAFGMQAGAAPQQFDEKVVVSATKDANNNATIAWTDPMQVKAIEHYIGHGKKGGFINGIDVGSAKQVVLKDIAKNGGRFNLVVVNGDYLHEECGGNDKAKMPTFRGLEVDCTCVKHNPNDHGTCDLIIPEGKPIPAGMHRVGALVVQ